MGRELEFPCCGYRVENASINNGEIAIRFNDRSIRGLHTASIDEKYLASEVAMLMGVWGHTMEDA